MDELKLVRILGFKIYSNTSGEFVLAKDLQTLLETAPCKQEKTFVEFKLRREWEPKPVKKEEIITILNRAGLETMAENFDRWGVE